MIDALLLAAVIAADSPLPAAEVSSLEVPPVVDAALDRLIAQYATLPGVEFQATHRVMSGSNVVLPEMNRDIIIIKPNKLRIEQNGVPLLVCDGTTAWSTPKQGTEYDTQSAPATLEDCITTFRQLGSGGIGGSGGLVAALMSTKPKKMILKDMSAVALYEKGDSDLIVLWVGPDSTSLRPGMKLGLFIPREGPAWPSRLDIIPPDPRVVTRISFDDWKGTDGADSDFGQPPPLEDRGAILPGMGKGVIPQSGADESESPPVAPAEDAPDSD